MSDPQERIDALEGQVNELRDQLSKLNRDLVDAQLEAWRGRVEELELQARLASMDARDDVSSMMASLRERWTDARTQVRGASGSASEALASLRSGFEQAIDDVRAAMRDAASQLRP